MFAEFGPAPLCLELDFDSFDGPPHWVARFRRMSGWMLVAKATIQSEHDILTAKLVAACDEQENPIPAFKALNLLHCDWINPTHCDELPPDLLDQLICEQEGELVRRWHREKNAGLAEAFEAHEQRIAEFEGRVRSVVRRNERRIADVRRRRRHPDTTLVDRAQLGGIIRDLEQENDTLVEEMAATRTRLREEAARQEEALWSREDLLVEVEPLHLIRWRPTRTQTRKRMVWLGGPGLVSIRGIQAAELAERERQREVERRAKVEAEAERRAMLAAERKEREARQPSRIAPARPRLVSANPVLLATLEGNAARIERQLAQPGLPSAKIEYLRKQKAKLSKRIARLQPRSQCPRRPSSN